MPVGAHVANKGEPRRDGVVIGFIYGGTAAVSDAVAAAVAEPVS